MGHEAARGMWATDVAAPGDATPPWTQRVGGDSLAGSLHPSPLPRLWFAALFPGTGLGLLLPHVGS